MMKEMNTIKTSAYSNDKSSKLVREFILLMNSSKDFEVWLLFFLFSYKIAFHFLKVFGSSWPLICCPFKTLPAIWFFLFFPLNLHKAYHWFCGQSDRAKIWEKMLLLVFPSFTVFMTDQTIKCIVLRAWGLFPQCKKLILACCKTGHILYSIT